MKLTRISTTCCLNVTQRIWYFRIIDEAQFLKHGNVLEILQSVVFMEKNMCRYLINNSDYYKICCRI